MATSKLSKASSPKISKDSSIRMQSSSPSSPTSVSKPITEEIDAQLMTSYENYVRLPELRKLWSTRQFPEWRNESIVRPALQALETTFRFISIALSDSRPYVNHREWTRKLESLASSQIQLVSSFLEGGDGAPVTDFNALTGIINRDNSGGSQVWKIPGTTTSFVSRVSETSLLPRLASWEKSEKIASKIGYLIEANLQNCPFTLGVGEPNLAGKPSLEYDGIVRPSDLHALKKSNAGAVKNQEDGYLFTVLQILECWLAVAGEILSRIESEIDGQRWTEAAGGCWSLESIWILLLDIEDLLLLMDTDDLLRLKAELGIAGGGGSFCFRSRAMTEAMRRSKELRVRVPAIVGAEVDPSGGPRVQEAAMRLFRRRCGEDGEKVGRVEVLKALQAVEAAVKRFFFGFRQVVSAAMGSLEAGGNCRAGNLTGEGLDLLSGAFLEPPYFPSLDAAKTFLGNYWEQRFELNK